MTNLLYSWKKLEHLIDKKLGKLVKRCPVLGSFLVMSVLSFGLIFLLFGLVVVIMLPISYICGWL